MVSMCSCVGIWFELSNLCMSIKEYAFIEKSKAANLISIGIISITVSKLCFFSLFHNVYFVSSYMLVTVFYTTL